MAACVLNLNYMLPVKREQDREARVSFCLTLWDSLREDLKFITVLAVALPVIGNGGRQRMRHRRPSEVW